MNQDLSKKPISVSQCVDLVKTTLQSVVGDLAIFGEVSEFQRRSSGSLVFFSLKDEASYIRCFMMDYELKTEITDGMEIQVTGYPSLFKKNGGFHIRVHSIELRGEGSLRKQFELTKKKLEKEGLFSPDRKRPLPKFPNTIGIITSEDAAAFTDVKRILSNRWPLATLQLVPAQVQGAPAVKQVVRAFDTMESMVKPDCIILTRGGGSLEDLQAFNDEAVCRRIFSCAIPVVTGIGHERDITLADYVADIRAATPSNAAELSTPDMRDILFQIDAMKEGIAVRLRHVMDARHHDITSVTSRMYRFVSSYLDTIKRHLQIVSSFGSRIREKIALRGEWIQAQNQRMVQSILAKQSTARDRLHSLASLLGSYSPKAILKRGYTITRKNGAVVRSSKELAPRDILKTTFADGDVESHITNT